MYVVCNKMFRNFRPSKQMWKSILMRDTAIFARNYEQKRSRTMLSRVHRQLSSLLIWNLETGSGTGIPNIGKRYLQFDVWLFIVKENTTCSQSKQRRWSKMKNSYCRINIFPFDQIENASKQRNGFNIADYADISI